MIQIGGWRKSGMMRVSKGSLAREFRKEYLHKAENNYILN